MNDTITTIASLEQRLAQGVVQHQQWNKDHQELHDAARYGQKPSMVIYHNGTIDPAALFDLPPAKAFCAGGFPLILRHPHQAGNCASIYPFLAAATFAGKSLGVQKQVMVLSSNGPLSTYMQQREMGPLMAPWADIWKTVIREAEEFAAQVGVKDIRKNYRLPFLALLSRNARVLEEFIGQKVTCCYLDMEKGILEIHPSGNLTDMWSNGSEERISNLGLYNGAPRALACSCCDSRAGHGHMYCAQPGEFLDANVIAAIVPPYKEIIENKIAHPVWGLAEHAFAVGVREAVVTGHSQCGGIKALVEWKALGNHPGEYLDMWLGQAAGVVEEVIAFARTQGFLFRADGSVDARVYTLAEISVTQWSARNLEEYFEDRAGAMSNVLAHYLKIDEREVYVLDPYASIEETALYMEAMTPLRSFAQMAPGAAGPRQLNKQRYKAKQLLRDYT